MSLNRRNFLKYSTLASASLLVPDFLQASRRLNMLGNTNGKTLVVIQLSGGNDGLNCVVPFRNDLYYSLRPSLSLDGDELVNITGDVALNSNLQGLADLYEKGNLAIINSVGYPNPNRSHFRSMDIWQSASDENKYIETGWVGRYLDSTCSGTCAKPHNAIELDDTLSLALKGSQMKGLAFREPNMLHTTSQNKFIRGVANDYHHHDDHPKVEFLHKTLTDTMQSADYIYEHSKIFQSKSIYPQHEFGRQMKLIAELICSGMESQIYYVSLSGFDTHALQKGAHSRVLKVYGDALKTFCDDLKSNNRFDDTIVMTFSEFGRRVKQNQSKGTDHGTASNIYIAGGKLSKAGLINPMPDLNDLDEGDLKYKVDFRQVYATLLEKHLKSDSQKVLQGKFETLNFI